jgi:organic radical activating enzyme
MKYSINEIFYSIQGEGRWSGFPAIFIRLSGCNLDCAFCDTTHKESYEMDERDILQKVKQYPTNRVVLTGGEPLIHDLTSLLSALQREGYWVHLETNGSILIRGHYRFAWITVSPKKVTFEKDIVTHADEVKVLCGMPNWSVICSFVKVFSRPDAPLYVMPVYGPNLEENTKIAIDYVLKNPKWAICLQLHKILEVR